MPSVDDLSKRLSAILPLLACPSCMGRLSAVRGVLSCSQCSRTFPVRDGLPILLPQEMQEPGAGAFSADDPVSRHPYSPAALDIIHAHPGGWILDLGAGAKLTRFENVVQLDIFRYPMTDIVGTADRLPFRDNAFQAVISQAVFEHLQYPEATASEIRRVLQPGGVLKIDTAFLQPEHGYPHHFYNATETGLRHWFRDFEIDWSGVESYQHPKWSLSWFLAVYLDRIGEEQAQILGAADLGRVLRVLERLAAGERDEADAPIIYALDALPEHELHTLAAGVSILARNRPKPYQGDDAESESQSFPRKNDDVRKLIAAREEISELREKLASQAEARVLAHDRGNYLAQFFPAFNSVQNLGVRAWAQFKVAAALRVVLPQRLWFWLRSRVNHHKPEQHGGETPAFLTVVVEPIDPIALIDTFFSMTHQTFSAWELIMIERPGQLPAVRRALRDFSRLDERVKIVSTHASTQNARLQHALSLADGSYVVNLPEGGVLVREAVQVLFTLVRNRPQTLVITSDFSRNEHELCDSMRCYGGPILDAASLRKDEFSFIVHRASGRECGVLAVDEHPTSVSHAYIPEVLFRQTLVASRS